MMNSYDSQTLYAYLLGILPSEETELLDEKTFTDPDLADSLDAAEKDLVDLYVNGELSGTMLEGFEANYMASPARRQNVLFARRFREFTENEMAADRDLTSSRSTVREKKIGFFESVAAWGGRQRVFQFAAAAAVAVLLVGGGWLLVRGPGSKNDEVAKVVNQNSEIGTSTPISGTPLPVSTQTPGSSGTNVKSEIPEASPIPKATPKPIVKEPRPVIASISLVPSLRGAQKLAELRLSSETTAANFAIGLESSDSPAYKVELRDQESGSRVWQAPSVRARKTGETASLNVNIPAKLLRSGIYSFTISSVGKGGATENVGDYPFRVVK